MSSDIKVCKVVLVGDSGVGKTCMISRYIYNQFKEQSDSTLGASFASKTIVLPKGQKVQLDIWDTAGQEKFRSVNKFFYKDAVIGILVYDITRMDSFKSVKEFWHDELKNEGAPDIVMALAGNKSDLFADEQVPETVAREYADEIKAPFSLTSASESTGIDELFKAVVGKYLGDDSITLPDVDVRKQGTVKITKETHDKATDKKERGKKCNC
ncbi:MAG: GTP-binding protein [archaeon]|nr:GTP-binding protein [archaeon]